ncbi:hypothetical protein [Mycobacterium sp.]|uniref:hypothetical protein n=1 Tax=Mycobacterium sp. TaxID=1785 RepID=UPI002C9057B7|nr:hypothetical protein [Mycobacterium sp.]HTQ20060.1 hypothetical protein [Mycobacterium sp.]
MTNTTFKSSFALVAVLVGVVSLLPAQWRASAGRVWSFAVYYLGYRMLSVQMSCGNLAVTGVPFVMKHV